MNEANEITDFMTNFAPEVDVIWGAAFDDTLGDKIRITILAAGFDVTISEENETSIKTKKGNIEPIPTPAQVKDDQERLAEEYGTEKMAKRQQDKARARYLVLTPEQMDNDEVMEIFERNPTFNRDVKVKDAVKEVTSPISKDGFSSVDDDYASPETIKF